MRPLPSRITEEIWSIWKAQKISADMSILLPVFRNPPRIWSSAGHKIIAENGITLAESPLFERESSILYGDIDYERIKFERSYSQNFESSASAFSHRTEYSKVSLSPIRVIDIQKEELKRIYQKNPFVPADPATVDLRCNEIFSIQSAGLAKRMEHSHSKKAIVGISGGLDSTLALLVCAETFQAHRQRPAGYHRSDHAGIWNNRQNLQ